MNINKKMSIAVLSSIAFAFEASAQTVSGGPSYGSFVITSASTATQSVTWSPAAFSGSYSTNINYALDTTGASGSYSLANVSSSGAYTGITANNRLGITGSGISGDQVSIVSSWASSHLSSSGPAANWVWDVFPSSPATRFNSSLAAIQADLVSGAGLFTIGNTSASTDFNITGTGTLLGSDSISVPGKQIRSWSATAVPEPSSAMLLALAGASFISRRKR